MKKGTIIALAVLACLIAVFFLTRDSPQTTVVAPYVVKKVDDLHRIEVTRPSEDGSELVVLEKKDDQWRMTRPIDAPLADAILSSIEEAFSADIRTDDLKLSAERANDLGLGEQAVKVALFADGSTEPAREFQVGNEITVESTRVQRSFIANSEGKLFRAQRSLEFARKPVSDLRSRSIFKGDRESLSEIVINGPLGRIQVLKNEENWVVDDGSFNVEKSVVNSFASTVSSLSATGFETEKAAADLELEPPQYSVAAKFGDTFARLNVSKVGEQYYAKLSNSPFIYEIPKFAAENMMLDAFKLRERVTHVIEPADIQTIEFAGEERVTVARDQEGWKMLRPERVAVSAEKMAGYLASLGAVRASRYEGISPEEAGISSSKSRVVIRGQTDYELVLGGPVADSEDVYAKWQHQDVVFVIPKFTLEKLQPKVSDLQDS